MLWEDKWVRVNQFFIYKLAYTSFKQTELKHANSLSMKFSSPLLLKQGILETTPNLCFDELLYWSNSWQTLSSRPSAHHLQSIWQVNPHWGAQPGRSYWFFYLYSDLDDARGRHQKKIRSKTQNYLNLYAVEGLRTLCIAKRVSVGGGDPSPRQEGTHGQRSLPCTAPSAALNSVSSTGFEQRRICLLVAEPHRGRGICGRPGGAPLPVCGSPGDELVPAG